MTGVIGASMGLQDGTYQELPLEMAIMIVLPIPIWIYGKKWNLASTSRVFIDKQT